MGRRDHVDFELEAHSGFLDVLPEHPVIEADSWEILHSGEAHIGKLAQEQRHAAERIGPAHTGQYRRGFDDRQHFARHVDDNRIGVAIGQQAGKRSAPGHAVAAGIVDDDEICAARLRALRRKPGACSGADDGAPFLNLAAKPPERFLSLHRLNPFFRPS